MGFVIMKQELKSIRKEKEKQWQKDLQEKIIPVKKQLCEELKVILKAYVDAPSLPSKKEMDKIYEDQSAYDRFFTAINELIGSIKGIQEKLRLLVPNLAADENLSIALNNFLQSWDQNQKKIDAWFATINDRDDEKKKLDHMMHDIYLILVSKVNLLLTELD